MEKLSIKQASERFNLSKARLYQLLDKGAVIGERAQRRGRGAGSWVDAVSLKSHIENRHENMRHGKGTGRPKITGVSNYVPVTEASKKVGYSSRHIDRLARIGKVASKQAERGGRLIDINDLLNYKYA